MHYMDEGKQEAFFLRSSGDVWYTPNGMNSVSIAQMGGLIGTVNSVLLNSDDGEIYVYGFSNRGWGCIPAKKISGSSRVNFYSRKMLLRPEVKVSFLDLKKGLTERAVEGIKETFGNGQLSKNQIKDFIHLGLIPVSSASAGNDWSAVWEPIHCKNQSLVEALQQKAALLSEQKEELAKQQKVLQDIQSRVEATEKSIVEQKIELEMYRYCDELVKPV